jgi:HD-GYP domain-containing protein (c-di-GMP phosphodiesterase class II)
MFNNFIERYKDPQNPVMRIMTISTVLIFTSSIILGLFLSSYLSYYMKKNNADTVSHFVKSYVKENFNEKSFNKNKEADFPNANFKAMLLEMKNSFKLQGVNIFDTKGRIIWSDNKEMTKISGRRLKKALKNKLGYSFVELENPNLVNDSYTNTFFRVSVPISFAVSNDVKAIFDVYSMPYNISSSIYTGWVVIWLTAAIIGFILHSVLIRGIKRTHQQTLILQQELIDYSGVLEANIQIITDVQNVAILGLSKLAEYRDKETGQHLERMSLYSKLISEELSKWDKYKFYITKDYVSSLFTSSVLHDIGKVGIPDIILLKPGRFTAEEYEIMKQHSKIGGDALAAADKQLGIESFLTIGKEVAYYHHERIDGKGYPSGKKGDDIPLSARIIAFADVFDALVSKRVYKPAYDYPKAKHILIGGEEDGHFDPDIVKAFLSTEKSFIEISEKYT